MKGVYKIENKKNVNTNEFWDNRIEKELAQGTSASLDIYNWIQKNITLERGNIIDLGSGKYNENNIAILCSRLNYVSYILDISDKFVKTFLDKNINGKEGNLENIPYEDNMFDIVCSSHSIEHTEDIEKALSEILRITKPSGYIIMNIPIGKAWGNSIDHNYWFDETVDFELGKVVDSFKGNQYLSRILIYKKYGN